MKQTYELTYDDFTDVATVEIDHAIAEPYIKEFVEFWGEWQTTLARNGGDYTKVFLKRLATFILEERRKPDDSDEGWPFYCEDCGIRIVCWEEFEFDEDNISIRKLS